MSNSLNSAGIGSRFVIRLILGLAIGAVVMTALGIIDLAKDVFGSHRNFADMDISEFRSGDIVYGTIYENIGCAATSSSSRFSRYGDQVDSYYYVVPYFAGSDDPFPKTIILFRTGNNELYHKLEEMFDATVDRYMGGNNEIPQVYIDRAEVRDMTYEEENAFREYVDAFVDAYYEYEGDAVKEAARNAYSSAIVTYTISYTDSSAGGIILTIGLVMTGILIIGALVFIAGTKRAASSSDSIYVGSHDPNLNAPTGLENASARYDQPTVPKETNTSFTRPVGSMRTDYSTSQRPMPPIEGLPEPPRLLRYDPQTGQPVYAIPVPAEERRPEPPEAPVEMDTIDLKNTDLVDTSNGGIDKTAESESSQPDAPASTDMPEIDLKDRSFADLSNGGTDDDSWEARANIAEMPMNGNIPVINPERYHSDAFFGRKEDMIPEGPTPEETVTPAAYSEDILVQPTDPSTRNIYSQIVGGGAMNSVDLATEENKDYSNGGVDRDIPAPAPITEIKAMPEAEFPETPAFPTVPEERPSFPTAAEEKTVLPTPEEEKPLFPKEEEKPLFPKEEEKPLFPKEEEKPIFPKEEKPLFPETKPETTDSYNIFKTDSSSYNIFKDPKTADNHMGFPIEDRDQPSLDISFPTADKKE